MIFRLRSSPLHSARAGVAGAYCLALVLATLVVSNPIVLGALAAAVIGAGAGARVGRPVLQAGRFALPFGLAIAVVNALVTRDGLTVILRLGDLPLLGHTDITLEATAAGGVLGLRAAILIMCGALYTAAVDPDEILRCFRRVSFRSALSASLATRMVPVLMRDSRRLADAQRCRPGRPPSRVALLRATANGVLDRALDVAATLELRGFGSSHRPPRLTRPWGRHDVAFALAAGVLAMLALIVRTAGLAAFTAYPSLSVTAGPSTLLVAAALIVIAVAPFADRRGVST